MKLADLREFAEKLYVSAPRHEEFAKEILALIDAQEDSVEAEMIGELEHQCQNSDASKVKTPLQMIEYLGDRDDVLTEIEERVEKRRDEMERYGIAPRPAADIDDTVTDFMDTLECIDAVLRAEGLRGDIHDMLDELIRRKEKPKLEYDL